MGEHAYLIRYGAMGHIGKFAPMPGCEAALDREQLVVIRTHRGIELGEVLVPVGEASVLATHERAESSPPSGVGDADSPRADDRPHIVRPAGPDDLDLQRQAEALRPTRFALCRRILDEGEWPLELIDVEPLLDGNMTVLHYLGPHQLDVRPLRAWFRMACDLEVMPEPFGIDPEGDLPAWMTDAEDDDAQAASGCGSPDCGSGGCGTRSEPSPGPTVAEEGATAACAPAAHAGCASCGIGRLRSKLSPASAERRPGL